MPDLLALTCPAAEDAEPVLSLNDQDVRCQIGGRLQPAEGSPCCGEYVNCGIWRTAKRQEQVNKTRILRQGREGAPRDVLSGVERERVRA